MADDAGGLPPPASASNAGSRPASAPPSRMSGSKAPSKAPSGASEGGSSEADDGLPKLVFGNQVYPIPVERPPPRPMSATQAARVKRVSEKKKMLAAQFLGRHLPNEPAKKGEKPKKLVSMPPWWSVEVHGDPGKAIAAPKGITTVVPIKGVRASLKKLRLALSRIPWADGRPVVDPERRIRGEVMDMEVWMRDHMSRKARRVYERCHAPAVSGKALLLQAFQRADVLKTGDVTVSEFADVWNNAETGMHLMVPVQRRNEDNDIVDVEVRPDVTVSEALQVWKTSAVYPLWDTDEDSMDLLAPDGEGRPLYAPKKVLEAHAAAFFLKYGYDKDGLMPYDVFCNSLFTTPGRLLGMEPIMNQKVRDRHGFGDGDDLQFDGKILYAKAKKGVFPPSDFDPKTAERSSKVPSASLQLEHVHGYAGLANLAPNLFYTDNPCEMVYYTAGVGVVLNEATNTQKFFFGHNNHIRSLALHPCKWIVATGQQKATGPTEVPYVCVWETRTCKQLQRLDHLKDSRCIIALGFSRDGKKLVSVASDNPHSLFIWSWMTDKTKLQWLNGEVMEPIPGWPKVVPGWAYGPDKKLRDLENSPSGFYYKYAFGAVPPGELVVKKGKKEGPNELGPAPTGAKFVPPDEPPPPMEEDEVDSEDPEAWMQGPDFALDPRQVFMGNNGAPPQVYGVVWNPFKTDEFITYGVKHIKWWRKNEEGNWEDGLPGSFGPTQVDNVLSAVFIRDSMAPYREMIKDKDTGKIFNKGNAKVTRTGKVIEYHRDPDDDSKVVGEEYTHDIDLDKVSTTIVLTGFPSGLIGIWLNELLMRVVDAHKPGPLYILPDGSCTYGGVRCLKLRADNKTVLSGGSDGCIYAWDVQQTVNDQPQYFKEHGDYLKLDGQDQDKSGMSQQGSKARQEEGSALRKTEAKNTGHSSGTLGRGAVKIRRKPEKWVLRSPIPGDGPPMFRALDSRPGSNFFIAGTNKCDVWELGEGGTSRCLNNGHTADLYACATHPLKPWIFSTAAESSNVRLWDASKRALIRATSVGFQCRSVQFSRDGTHMAVGGKLGRLKVLKADTMQPLVTFKRCTSAIDELKYSPDNRLLAAGSHDLCIDIYDTGFRGPGGSKKKPGPKLQFPQVNTVWEKEKGGKGEYAFLARCQGHSATVSHLDFSLPLFNPPALRGKTIIVSNCNGYEILYFDPLNGKQILANQRNAKWHTRTTMLGFDVMGIWPDGSMNTHLNALDRSKSHEYCITGDNYSLVKIFNYPCCYDDAPWREYRGHSSFVCCVRWSADDRWVITAGGNDRSSMQYRSMGVNKVDSFPDRRKETPWCDVAECLYCGREPLPPPPPPLWGPLDEEGRTWGPIEYNPKTGKDTSKNTMLRLMQEFRVFDTEDTGVCSRQEFKLVLSNFGETQVTSKRVDEELKKLSGEDYDEFGNIRYPTFAKIFVKEIKDRYAAFQENLKQQQAEA